MLQTTMPSICLCVDSFLFTANIIFMSEQIIMDTDDPDAAAAAATVSINVPLLPATPDLESPHQQEIQTGQSQCS
jgi:hypothetical protein